MNPSTEEKAARIAASEIVLADRARLAAYYAAQDACCRAKAMRAQADRKMILAPDIEKGDAKRLCAEAEEIWPCGKSEPQMWEFAV